MGALVESSWELVDAVDVPIFSVDMDLRYVATNAANRRVVRGLYGCDIALGDRVADVTASDPSGEAVCECLRHATQGQTVTRGQWFGQEPYGRRFFSVTYTPLVRDDETVGAVAVAIDETAVQELLEQLAVSEARFSAAFHASTDAININRLSDGMYLETNAGFERLTGFSEKDVVGKTSHEIEIWSDPADRRRLVDALERDGHTASLSAIFRRKDGSHATGEMAATIIDVGGEHCILSVTRDVTERERMLRELAESNRRLERLTRDVVATLGRVVEARDPYTQGHERRVSALCRLMAQRLGLDERAVDALEMAALLHDIGKLAVPAEILTKPGTLTEAEMRLVREHPTHSYDILKGIAFEEPIAEIAYQHHERLDGSGYPRGLRGTQISQAARILGVADLVEAMESLRPYRPSLVIDAAIEELRREPEKYDPTAVAALLALQEEGALEF